MNRRSDAMASAEVHHRLTAFGHGVKIVHNAKASERQLRIERG